MEYYSSIVFSRNKGIDPNCSVTLRPLVECPDADEAAITSTVVPAASKITDRTPSVTFHPRLISQPLSPESKPNQSFDEGGTTITTSIISKNTDRKISTSFRPRSVSQPLAPEYKPSLEVQALLEAEKRQDILERESRSAQLRTLGVTIENQEPSSVICKPLLIKNVSSHGRRESRVVGGPRRGSVCLTNFIEIIIIIIIYI